MIIHSSYSFVSWYSRFPLLLGKLTIELIRLASLMDFRILRKIESLYKKSDQLLKSGRFGEGLWPLDPQVGQLLSTLIRSYGWKCGIEVGAGVGYSTIWLAEGFRQTSGKLLSLEYFFPKIDQLEKNLEGIFSW